MTNAMTAADYVAGKTPPNAVVEIQHPRWGTLTVTGAYQDDSLVTISTHEGRTVYATPETPLNVKA